VRTEIVWQGCPKKQNFGVVMGFIFVYKFAKQDAVEHYEIKET
jgi:hypothetical protein